MIPFDRIRLALKGARGLALDSGAQQLDAELAQAIELLDAARAEPGASEGLAERIRESLDANNAWEWNDAVNGTQTGFDGNKDILAEAIARDLAASPSSDTRPGLREAISVLENYGDHHEWCIRADGAAEPCNCGLWDQLERLRAALAAEFSEGETP